MFGKGERRTGFWCVECVVNGENELNVKKDGMIITIIKCIYLFIYMSNNERRMPPYTSTYADVPHNIKRGDAI